MICLPCPECKKANLRAEPIIENDICDNCRAKLIPCECPFCQFRKRRKK